MISDLEQPWANKGLRWPLQVLVFVVGAFLVFSRRPDALLYPQFWAEDGATWFAQAYNVGWLHALALPEGGYLNILPRLVASVALLLPFRFAPLLMNCVGLCLQVLPVCLLLSSRCSAWGNLANRLLYGVVYLALPNSWEIDVNITDAHFHLALAAFLVALGSPPSHKLWKTFDVVVLLLSGLTGPWDIALLPFAALFWWVRRYRWSLVVCTIVAVCAITQASVLLGYAGAGARDPTHLGATPMRFLRLLSGNVFSGALVGENGLGLHGSIPVIALVALLGTALLFYTLLHSQLELRLFIAFCFLLFAASLRSPYIRGPVPQWLMLLADHGARYWFFPMLATAWSLIWCAFQARLSFVRSSAFVALAVMVIGVVRDWRYKPYEDKHFQQYAARFSTARQGTLVEVPINPDGWVVRLKKKAF